ncbi:MAG: hypothetical protein K0R03_1617 [Moraxellaceae bacterium]|nr:hypothetical protein [Moraxellaceae bacterium]
MATHGARGFGLLGTILCCALFCAPPVSADDAAALRARHAALRPQLANNPFNRPLHLESRQQDGTLQGDIYAQIAQPFAVAGPALQGTEQWCEILILHLNVKSCRANGSRSGAVLRLHIGRKFDQPLDDAYPVQFTYRVAASRPDYLRVVLDADKGPMNTHDYRIVLEAVPLDATRSFLHLSYSYAYGMSARVAMRGYLSTIGRNKVGFSIVKPKAKGRDKYIGGMRGVVERNTMRYYLAVEAYLGALSAPPGARVEKRLNDWFAANERYPLQLHEIGRAEYLAMKRKEIQRQQAAGK